MMELFFVSGRTLVVIGVWSLRKQLCWLSKENRNLLGKLLWVFRPPKPHHQPIRICIVLNHLQSTFIYVMWDEYFISLWGVRKWSGRVYHLSIVTKHSYTTSKWHVYGSNLTLDFLLLGSFYTMAKWGDHISVRILWWQNLGTSWMREF